MHELRTHWRAMAASNGLWIALASFAACGGSTGSAGEVTDAGGDAATPAGDLHVACDHYFDAQYRRCGGPRLPEDETARIRSRFQQACANQVALPGSGVTAASLAQCASALDVSDCQWLVGWTLACDFHGSLSGGAACADNAQCASAKCRGIQERSPSGQTSLVSCGTCAPAVAAGKVCAQGQFYSVGCDQGAFCPGESTAADDLTWACTEIVQKDLGAPCGWEGDSCKPGLLCARETQTCVPLGAAEAVCDPGPRGAGGCAPPLACGASSGTCRSSSAGTPCGTQGECAPGLACVSPGPPLAPGEEVPFFGRAAWGRCAAVAWAGSGEPCSEAVRCLVGYCSAGGQQEDGGLSVGVCPTVLADGAPCGAASTCDTLAHCFQGTCTLLDAVSCE